MNISNDDELFKQLEALYKATTASPEFKDRLFKRLNAEISAKTGGWTLLFWKQPKFWAPLATALVIAALSYGVLQPTFNILNNGPTEGEIPITEPSPSPTPLPPGNTEPTLSPTPTPTPTPTTPAPTPNQTTPPAVIATGTLEIRVTDTPPQRNVEEINVNLSNIEVHRAGDEQDPDGEWIMVLTDAESFDLIKLRDAGVEEILGNEEVPIGHYTQIRMDVELVDALIDGIRVDTDVMLPSGKLRIVGSFYITENQTTILTIDFDADKSLIFTGQGKVLFKPVVKLIVTNPS